MGGLEIVLLKLVKMTSFLRKSNPFTWKQNKSFILTIECGKITKRIIVWYIFTAVNQFFNYYLSLCFSEKECI